MQTELTPANHTNFREWKRADLEEPQTVTLA